MPEAKSAIPAQKRTTGTRINTRRPKRGMMSKTTLKRNTNDNNHIIRAWLEGFISDDYIERIIHEA